MNESELKPILEALLMNSNQPLSLEEMQGVFDEWQRPSRDQLLAALNQLAKEYETRAIELKCLASGYCLQTKIEYSVWISRLYAEKPAKYSRALLETLAIVAYRQPVTRADIEDIRGVAVSSSILKTLLEREWIRVAGHRDVPGKPAVYVTTKIFLDYFNLSSLSDLPALDTITDPLATVAKQPIEECVE
ncbi:SMC-Scp complex subunit ScpB [Legionella micdadei]|uniref:Segregation and condensation protein B n=1 Tax=Legionella micdadei TaxID=451 RepID=A0A098GF22_LEGMI|nr:SMC-Scp complex subunit ScpB [Legionella micdadei]ARG97444.1 SMC-Scp complex subunit ScpB [Legionella micdadei]ARH00247.1 SMC-Scp complex subunit ScpB [Legionella micdadei]KTD28337.1 segregation and condensation protein B [Legionella micdadei]NSL16965.1 SMC-Scp complex subunit ScpB [Legionella micdadei]CEG61073.1 Segregation and condensation protein B homolog [Legionella micdadei]